MDTKQLLNTRVKEVMTTDLHVVNPQTVLKEVNDILERVNLHHLPVVDEKGIFHGIISKSDMLMLFDWGTKLGLSSSTKKNDFMLANNLAKDIMVTQVVCVNPEDSLQKCLQIFRENYFHALPVINENRILQGIVTTFDMLILAYTEKPQILGGTI